MSTRQPDLQLAIRLPPAGSGDVLRSLHQQLREAILDARLPSGTRMPSTRALAALHGVSRNTALAAYDLLLSEGYLRAMPRGGTYVATSLPPPATRKAAPADAATERRLNAFWRDPPRIEGHPVHLAPAAIDFGIGTPDQSALRFDIWQRLAARTMRAYARDGGGYDAAQGRPALREAIARHAAFTRAVACGSDDLLVTCGIQQALDLLARILVTAGKTVVAVEDPGCPPMRAAFAAAGARVVPVPVDDEGLVVELLPRDTRIIYVTPSHQFPLGCVMSMRRRAALLAFAQQNGAVILEDDYDCEFRYGARPLDALQTLDRSESVFYLGTFSKTLFPGLRIGYVAAPAWAMPALRAAKRCADWHSAVPLQDTLAAFIDEGHLARHVRKMRQVYGERRAALLDGLEKGFEGVLAPIDSSAGLHLSAWAAPSLDLALLTARARAAGVGIYTLDVYYAGAGGRPGLGFGYGTVTPQTIGEGLARLRQLAGKALR